MSLWGHRFRATGWGVAALIVALAGGTALAQGQAKPDNKKPDAASQAQASAQAQEVQGLVQLADAAMTGQQVPSDFPIQFQNDFLKAQGGRVWVPIILTLDPAKLSTGAITFYLRVAPRGMTAPPAAPPPPDAKKNEKDNKKKDKDKDKDKDAKPSAPPSAYPFEDVSFLDLKPVAGQPLRILRGFSAPAGSYDVYLVLRERVAAGATPKAAVLKQPLDVPNFSAGEFATSSVIIAERVDTLPAPVSPDQQTEHPYAFGQQEIVVSPDHKFKKSQELIVLLQIYDPTISSDKKFNLEVTYTFYKTGADGEKKFNATEPQTFTPESMGAGFDPAGPEHSIQAGQGIPLTTFPEGAYRLEIKVTDKLANPGKVLTQNVNFTVTS
jgi:hypothetical protein